MIKIINFKPEGVGSQWHGSEEDLLADEGFMNLRLIYEHLEVHKFCHVIVLDGDYKGSVAKFTIDEAFERFNLKTEGDKLLSQATYDIDGNELSEGDEVLYLNLRYGSGGTLCHGNVKSFKAHARDGYVSVIIENKDNSTEESECRQPFNQIYKKQEMNYD